MNVRNTSVVFPAQTVEHEEVVSAVRALLRDGLPEDFMRSCVRIAEFEIFSGGLKASLVGALRINVHAAMKLGDDELNRHATLIRFVNERWPRTFPGILDCFELGGGRVLLFMENLRGYKSLQDLVYIQHTPHADLQRIADHACKAVGSIHALNLKDMEPALKGWPKNDDPFSTRLQSKIDDVVRTDPVLETVIKRAGVVNGFPCPPVIELLHKAAKYCAEATSLSNVRLIHGDPHLANIMARRRGTYGYSVRLIDPNPEIGIAPPLYDIGKLLHWAEPVGWARVRNGEVCAARWASSASRGWRLDVNHDGSPKSAERRRITVEQTFQRFAETYRSEHGALFSPMLHIAIASAHLGLAALVKGDEHKQIRRFVFAHALLHLRNL